MREQDDYVVCIVGGRHEYFPDTGAAMRGWSADRLRHSAAGMLRDWPGAGAELVAGGDPTSFFLVEMHTSVPCGLDALGAVTLLGDAVHVMTPTLGRGANAAMRDGALLGRALRAVADGRTGLGDALAAYERAMLAYGFTVVREAARIGGQRMAQNPLPDPVSGLAR